MNENSELQYIGEAFVVRGYPIKDTSRYSNKRGIGMLFKFIFFMDSVAFALFVIHCPEIMIYTVSRLNRFIKKSLRSNEAFMRWLYGDDHSSKNLEVKVYNDGWRKGDYK